MDKKKLFYIGSNCLNERGTFSGLNRAYHDAVMDAKNTIAPKGESPPSPSALFRKFGNYARKLGAGAVRPAWNRTNCSFLPFCRYCRRIVGTYPWQMCRWIIDTLEVEFDLSGPTQLPKRITLYANRRPVD